MFSQILHLGNTVVFKLRFDFTKMVFNKIVDMNYVTSFNSVASKRRLGNARLHIMF